jgi:hypothetical protein
MTTNPATLIDEAALLDDHAVDLVAKAMKAKLALKRQQGFGGWHDISQCTGERLAELLLGAVAKGDPVDVANFAMMLFCRHENHDALKAAYAGALAAPQQEPVAPFAYEIKDDDKSAGPGALKLCYAAWIDRYQRAKPESIVRALYDVPPPPASPALSDDEIFNALYSISDEAIGNDEVIASGRRLLAKVRP